MSATSIATKNRTLVDYVKAQYTGTQGANNIYYHDASLTNGAGDNSYRYAGANPNNYVCFGSTTTPCPENNLYRIIGVFEDKVKLIRNKSVRDMYWNNHRSNTWSTSSLNTYLNNEFINTLDIEAKGKIAEKTWKVGGNSSFYIESLPVKTAYQNEVVNPVPGSTSSNGETEYSTKIGLMYASDYGFAAAPSAWTATLISYNGEAIKNVNWMYMGLMEWTISRHADNSDSAFDVDRDGYIDAFGVDGYALGVRPVFNLVSSVTYVSGDGSINSPFRIN